jgi:hypothetical protein
MLLIAIVLRLSAFGQVITSMPSDCRTPDLLANGKPVMTPIGKDLALGISLARHEFKTGDQIKLHIWAVNSGDAPANVWTCPDLDHFKAWGFYLFVQGGRRILSRNDLQFQEKLLSEHIVKWKFSPCKRSFQIEIPAHTCMTRDDYDFAIELTSRYDLPPGEYTLRIRPNWKDTERNPDDWFKPQGNEQFHAQQGDLTFNVIKP